MSLQYETNLNRYAKAAASLWTTWRSSTTNHLWHEAVKAIKSCTTFLPPIDFRPYTKAKLGDFGVQYPLLWQIRVNRYQAMLDGIPLFLFLEWVVTPYHESRHAEQTYRIAQGVLAGEISFPNKDLARQIQAAMIGRSPREIARAYQAGNPFEVVDAPTRRRIIQNWLEIPPEVILHADVHRTYFNNFLTSNTPSWLNYRTEPIKNAVIDWMKASYDHHLGDLDRRAQNQEGSKTSTGGYGRMYMTLPEEKDAYGIEEGLKAKILALIGKRMPDDENDTPP